MRLATLIERGIRSFGYTYDFGGDWRNKVAVETIEAADPAVEYPHFLSGAVLPTGGC